MIWWGGDGSRAFRTGAASDRTGWLDVGQVAEKATIMSAMKVKSQEKQERLLELGLADHDYDNLSSSSIQSKTNAIIISITS